MTTTNPNPKTLQNWMPRSQMNPSYTLRVIGCILVIFLTELCLSHYIYRLIKSEMNEDYVQKKDFKMVFFNELRGEGRAEILRILKEFHYDVNEKVSKQDEKLPENYYINGTSEGNRVDVPDTTQSSANRISSGLQENKLKQMLRREKRYAEEDNLLNLPNDEPNVEFFNPKLRGELEVKDELERQRTGRKGAAPGGDSWVWLTSYSRIPLAAIQGFCSATAEYCPPVKMGVDGRPGHPGSKGDRGDTGLPGIPGPIGPRGYPGLQGGKGEQGKLGLDGRDGIPGEPGFDGKPGRNGHDGLPGIDGKGGIPGMPGRNGTDGQPGLMGPQGPPGPQGPTGLTGPRGRPGKPGNHGTPGIPGINAWKTKVNGSSALLIPPSIVGNMWGASKDPIIVYEGENVRLRCAANGVPKPHVEWRRTDGQLIFTGTWQASSIPGETLNITHVNRVHMGQYQCIADNGVPPQTNHTFNLEVHFPPLIRIRNQMVGAANGTTATLDCEVEAFPESVRYWERTDGRLLEQGMKYQMSDVAGRGDYKARMQLNITRINQHDYTMYHCISKNERGITKGAFTVYEVDPGLATPPPIVDGSNVAVFGVQPPEIVSLEQLCPPPAQCPDCPDVKDGGKCSGAGFSLFDLIYRWSVRQFGEERYPGYPNRSTNCELYAVGKPVYHGFINQTYGSWMRDPLLPMSDDKFWITNESDSYRLFQFDDKDSLRKNTPSRYYRLDYPFQGNSHVVYNGSFFYHLKGTNSKIIKYNLANESVQEVTVPKLVSNNSNYLYTTDYNYLDFSVDDNGLWVVYPVYDANNTAVMKVDANTMKIQYIWNISMDHHKVGEMFVVCGVLYAIDSVTDRNTKIRFALDLYKNLLLDVNLSFSNPFRRTTMVGYDHKHKELYTWDKGNQLTYPVRYHEIGYNSTDNPGGT